MIVSFALSSPAGPLDPTPALSTVLALERRERREYPRIVGDVGDAEAGDGVGRYPRAVRAVDLHASAGCRAQPHDDLESGALAKTITPEQADALARARLERRAVQDVR